MTRWHYYLAFWSRRSTATVVPALNRSQARDRAQLPLVLQRAGNGAPTGPGFEISHRFSNELEKGRKARQRRATRPPPQSTETVPRRLAASLRAS